jgi:hypothetical protein
MEDLLKHTHNPFLVSFINKNTIKVVLKVDIDIITSIAASPTGRAVIFVLKHISQ